MTYEQLLASDTNYRGSADSWQDYLDRREWEKMIRALPTMCTYRTNYIQYLFRHFTTGREMFAPREIITGESAYYDILYAMAAGITKDEIDAYMTPDPESYQEGIAVSMQEMEDEALLTESDPQKRKARLLFDRVGILDEPANTEEEASEDEKTDESDGSALLRQAAAHLEAEKEELEQRRQSAPDYAERLKRYHDTMINDYEYELETDPAFRIRMNRPEGSRSPYPTEWFTLAEVKAFIGQNLGPAVTEEEKALDAALAEINALCPATLEYYYSFPQDWEDAGIADTIRGFYGIDKPKKQEDACFVEIPEGIEEELV